MGYPSYMLSQIGVQCGRPCSPSQSEPVQGAVQDDPPLQQQFTTAVHTFHATSTDPINQPPPSHFRARNIVAHTRSSGGVPSPNVCCANLTNSSHLILTGSFLCVAYRIHPIKSYARMPDGPPTMSTFSPLTASTTSASVGIPSSMSACLTRSGTLRPSVGQHL